MSITCRQEALRWVHRYAAAGAVFAAIPLPVTTAGLATIETHMIGFIGSIYGDPMSGTATAATGGTLAIAGQGLKWAALQLCTFVPVAGIPIKMAISVGVIEGIGHAIIDHYERKYPGKQFTQKSELEQS
ncbi:MAG: hypothetical protein IPK82_15815 [Polyangiaceae bacterium]|nr:hypothetical protein [Polyangiaceae bacterium]